MSRFEQLGRWSARHRWAVAITWAVLILASVPLALQTPGALRPGGFISDDLESARAKALLETEILVPQAALVIVFHSETARAGEPAFEALANATTDEMAAADSYKKAPEPVSSDAPPFAA